MNAKKVKRDFYTHEVVALTGFTKYMLDYLSREEIFAPLEDARKGRGIRRTYSYEDVVLLRALCQICSNKGKISHLREALQQFRKEFGPLKAGQHVNRVLFVQGDELCIFDEASGGRQLRTGQRTLSFVVDLLQISSDVASKIHVDSKTANISLLPSVALEAERIRTQNWEPMRLRREQRDIGVMQRHKGPGSKRKAA